MVGSAAAKAVKFYTSNDGRRISALAKAATELQVSLNATPQDIGHPILYRHDFDYAWGRAKVTAGLLRWEGADEEALIHEVADVKFRTDRGPQPAFILRPKGTVVKGGEGAEGGGAGGNKDGSGCQGKYIREAL
jgi:hypothetical protein